MTDQDLSENYVSVPRAGLELGMTSTQVYRLAQNGKLATLCIGSRWHVARASIEQFKASRGLERASSAA